MNRIRACWIAIVPVSFLVAVASCGGGGSSSSPDSGGPEASTPDATLPDAPSAETSADAPGLDAVEAAATDALDAPSDAASDGPTAEAATDAAADSTSTDAPADAPPESADVPACDTDFWVDPVNGNDMTGTGCASTDADAGAGDAGTASCAWQTITHATHVIGTPCGPTRLHVIGPATVGAAETYPLLIVQNIVLTTEGGAVELDVPPTTGIGIIMAGPGSGIRGGAGAPFTISGPHDADGGVDAGIQTGIDIGDNVVSTLENVVVTYFHDGIVAQTGSSLDVPQGLVVTSNQTGADLYGSVTIHTDGASTSFSNNGEGLNLFGTASVVGTSGGKLQVNANGDGCSLLGQGASLTIAPTAAASFDGNTGTALTVISGASLTMTGTPGVAPGTGTITVSNNPGNGINFYAAMGDNQPQSTLTGVVVYGNGARGLYIDGTGAPRVKMRRSIVLANGFNGLWIDQASNLAYLDFGTTAANDGGADYGYNVLQAALGAGANVPTGLCLSSAADAGVLAAAGNVFAGPRDCSLAYAGTITTNSDCVTGTVDLGIMPGTGDVLTANCTH